MDRLSDLHRRQISEMILNWSNNLISQGMEYDEVVMCLNSEYRQKLSKVHNFVEITVPAMREIDFKTHFRLTRTSVEEIFSMIGHMFHTDNMKISMEKQVLVTLWYMANSETHRQIASRFNVSNSTSYKIVQNNLKYITSISDTVIKWPCNNEQLLTLKKFQNLRNKVLPGVFGAIDGCHIKILAPWVKRTVMPPLNKSMFYNRKQVPTVILQGIVDADQKFINIFCGWPGSSHDARVLRRSIIGNRLLNNPWEILPRESFILGDSAYPLTEAIMTPYKNNGHLTPAQIFFNQTLSSSRVVVEQSFGKLIGRFRKLRLLDVYHKSYCGLIITAACVLHNICMSQGDDIEVEEYEQYIPPAVPDTGNGINKRDQLCALNYEQ
ncbi:putative nuclease HARBI1 [Acyrthosiphon pisum]|uniref:DDE Tnp4 domain-containing protein n=1 Tax=Acyrthosiphon pisum TaxID=7029 RepID=A0A8R2BBR6_ACYPI|nr:putative nuclease HARBI1 [Acyrthosiphon pisum]|eukprot:XP_008189991.1 PREDICTED: putative nuclease HARBI1 [Acyrthosiphon pisum]